MNLTAFALERSTGHLKELVYACMKLVGVQAPGVAVNDVVVDELRRRLPESVIEAHRKRLTGVTRIDKRSCIWYTIHQRPSSINPPHAGFHSR